MREVINALLYREGTGCLWVALPAGLPAKTTVYTYFRRWWRDGDWPRIYRALRRLIRDRACSDRAPPASTIDMATTAVVTPTGV